MSQPAFFFSQKNQNTDSFKCSTLKETDQVKKKKKTFILTK